MDGTALAPVLPQQGDSGGGGGGGGGGEGVKEAALLTLVKDTGYPISQENGQRKYGPCPFWKGPIPGRGCEVFVGKLPRDCFEDELVPVLSRAGTIYELRLMMEFSGSNRGFCFVTYTRPDEAKRAVRELNNLEIRKGKFLGVCQSVDNCRLFVGGLPRDKRRPEILDEIRRMAEGVVDCIVYADVRDKTKNRGFAFVEFESHRAAAMARRKLVGSGPVQMWGQQIAIDWAEPELEIDEEIMSQVKILYVRNLTTETTEETIEKIFNEAVKKDDAVERVKKLRDYAFVHFRDRNEAIAAMKQLNGAVIDGANVEVVLAKPVDKNYSVKKSEQPQLIGLPGGMTYIQGSSLVASSSQDGQSGNTSREMLGRNPLVMGTRDGFKGRVRGAGGIGRVYSQARAPYKKSSPEARGLGIYPAGMEVVIASPFIFSPPVAQAKHPAQILDDLCLLYGWGQPVCQMFSALKQEDNGSAAHLFFCELWIPSLSSLGMFRSPVFSLSADEAKDGAAQCALLELSKKGLVCSAAVGSPSLNPGVGSLPAVLPAPAPSLPAAGPTLTVPGIYPGTQIVPPSLPQFMLTSGSYGELQPDLSPPSSIFPMVAGPAYIVSGGKAPMGSTFPVVSSIPYATIPTYKF